jgi:hypothetical protein
MPWICRSNNLGIEPVERLGSFSYNFVYIDDAGQGRAGACLLNPPLPQFADYSTHLLLRQVVARF